MLDVLIVDLEIPQKIHHILKPSEDRVLSVEGVVADKELVYADLLVAVLQKIAIRNVVLVVFRHKWIGYGRLVSTAHHILHACQMSPQNSAGKDGWPSAAYWALGGTRG